MLELAELIFTDLHVTNPKNCSDALIDAQMPRCFHRCSDALIDAQMLSQMLLYIRFLFYNWTFLLATTKLNECPNLAIEREFTGTY